MLKFDYDNDTYPILYTFEKGEHQDESYVASVKICSNPLCRCNHVHLSFRSDEKDELESNPNLSYNVSFNVIDQTIDSTEGKINLNFAKSLINNFLEQDWNLLRELYFKEKIRYTEEAVLTGLEPSFPLEEIEKESILIAYDEILPYARTLSIQVEDYDFVIHDLYCVHPHCNCNDVHILFTRIMKDEGGRFHNTVESHEETYIILSLKTKKWKVEEQGTLLIKADKMMAELFKKYNPFDLFRERYRTLRILYLKYRTKMLAVPKASQAVKVGRNDPCPCDSGKKYKKCCMQKEE